MTVPICPGMTVDQVIEKITISQDWAIKAFQNLPTAPAKERAVFGLAVINRPLLAASLPDLVPQAAEAMKILAYYMLEDVSVILSEANGQIDLTEKIAAFISAKPLTREVALEGDLLSLIDKAAEAFKSGAPWPDSLTSAAIKSNDHFVLGKLLNRAPLVRAEVLQILDQARSMNSPWLIKKIYTHKTILWNEVLEALEKDPADTHLAQAAAARSDLSDKALEQLVSLGGQDVYITLFDHQRSRLTDEHFKVMLNYLPAPYLELALAASPHTPHWVLLELAKSPSIETQMTLELRLDLPEGVRAQLRQISSHLAAFDLQKKLDSGIDLSKDDLKTGLTSPYKSVRISTITKGVGKKR